MTNVKKLLLSMKDNVYHRERDFITKLPSDLTLEEKRQELRKNPDKYFWHHQSLSGLLYYCVKKGYVLRRKRTKRNYEYKRKISLKDLENKK